MSLTSRLAEGLKFWLLLVVLLPAIASAEPAPLHPPSAEDCHAALPPGFASEFCVDLPPVHDEIAGITLDIAIDRQASLAIGETPYWDFFAAGVMAVPLSYLNPFYGVGVLAPVVGSPANAVFNARRAILVRSIAAEPLPQLTLHALQAQLVTESVPRPQQVQLRIASYGLATLSGAPAIIYSPGENLCLTVAAQLIISGPGGVSHQEAVQVGMDASSVDLPSPVCASMSRFAAEDGLYLRQSIQELAEVLAALIRLRLVRPL